MALKLLIKNFLKKGEAYHFARTEVGPIQNDQLHAHDFSELFWVESGHGLHWVQGKKLRIDAATLVFVRADDFHTVGAATTGEKLLVCNLAFPTSAWRAVVKRHSGHHAGWFCRGVPERREHFLVPPAFDFLRRSGLEMSLAPRSGLMLERFLLNLSVVLEGRKTPPLTRTPLWLSESLKRVEREGLFREGPQALTRLAARSQEHVERESKRWLQKTPTALINEMRMRYATNSLSTTQKEIIDICYDCGLENVGHFYTLFREHLGMTPRQYRLTSQSIVRPVP